uniref:Uncharacterized protein n=2 Tax=Palpitomonas bilix TaxID=652834 RepID=A0A7S3LXC4_9EUKA|mmetsp:Transcript_8097/g.21412  ORF Transcript_8097/g.21412 Transcript_8097/m.21412 type:complete len:353 (+) Transcript_8097:478-1536(+)
MIRPSVAKKVSMDTIKSAVTAALKSVVGKVSNRVHDHFELLAKKPRTPDGAVPRIEVEQGKGSGARKPMRAGRSPAVSPGRVSRSRSPAGQVGKSPARTPAKSPARSPAPRPSGNHLGLGPQKAARRTSLRSDGGGALKVHIPEEYLVDHILRGLKVRLEKASDVVDSLEREMMKSGMTADAISEVMEKVDEAVKQEERWRDAIEQRVSILHKRERTQRMFETPPSQKKAAHGEKGGDSTGKKGRRRGSGESEKELSPIVRVPRRMQEKSENEDSAMSEKRTSPTKKKKSMAPLRQREAEERVYKQVLLSQMHLERRAARVVQQMRQPPPPDLRMAPAAGMRGGFHADTRPW